MRRICLALINEFSSAIQAHFYPIRPQKYKEVVHYHYDLSFFNEEPAPDMAQNPVDAYPSWRAPP